MLLIVGYVVILLASVGTYAVHGSLAALWMPMEYVAILGLAAGGFVAGNGIKTVKATLAALPKIFKGSHLNKALYMNLLAMLFEVLTKVRKEGLMSIENDVENPEQSPIFSKYPEILGDHHVMEFLCDYLRMMVGGNLNAFEIENLMDIEIETHHQEAHIPGAIGFDWQKDLQDPVRRDFLDAEAFGAAAIGRASVMAVVLFVILVGVTFVQHLYFRRRITYDLT